MVVWHLADVTLNPSVNALPGGGTLQELTNGLGAWALIAALAGLLIGAAPPIVNFFFHTGTNLH